MRPFNIYFSLLIMGIFLSTFNLPAQSIRKNYQEMTQAERDALVAAFYQLREGADLINDLASFHGENFSDIHFNLPDEPEKEVFFAWHRRAALELEHAFQDLDSKLSIPFWDWREDQDINSLLWSEEFLGSFDAAWSLGRTFSGTLPTDQDVTEVQAITDWYTYVEAMEKGAPHVGPHGWVGGIMSGKTSPGDPVFWLHHNMIDKLWQEWEEVNQSSMFIKTTIPRYDGTYVFDGDTLEAIDPNDIVDSRTLGVFFADDQLATLDNYEVSNINTDMEHFFYQYKIEAENGFNIPSGKKALFESESAIVLKPGFQAQSGADFVAKITPDAPFAIGSDPLARIASANIQPFEGSKENIYDKEIVKKRANYMGNQSVLGNMLSIEAYPNPFREQISIEYLLPEDTEVKLYIRNNLGQLVKVLKQGQEIAGLQRAQLQTEFPKGIYYLILETSYGRKVEKIIAMGSSGM